MTLLELFDRAANFTTNSNNYSEFSINGKDYSVEFGQRDDGIYDVAFGLLGKPGYEGYRGVKYGMQGTGDEIAVFSTVLAIIKRFVERASDLQTLSFSADVDEPSRVGLYDRLLRKFATHYDVHKRIDDGVIYYTINKRMES